MRKTKRFLIKTGLIASALTVMTCSMTFASRISDFKIEEYSNEYKQWLQLSDEERQKTIAPPMYEIPISEEKKENPLLMAKAARASMTSRFSSGKCKD